MLGFVVTAEDPTRCTCAATRRRTTTACVLRRATHRRQRASPYRVWEPSRPRPCRGVVRRARLPRRATAGRGDAGHRRGGAGAWTRSASRVEYFHENDADRAAATSATTSTAAPSIARIDHFNICVDDAKAAYDYYESLGLPLLGDDRGRASACTRRGCTASRACTTSPSPAAPARACTTSASSCPSSTTSRGCATRSAPSSEQHHIERGPGRHGVSNAFYVYLRDPDGHRIEIYTSDYFTGDPDEETLRWSVNDMRRRDFWGAAVVPTWYAEATDVLDLDGKRVAAARRRHVDVGGHGRRRRPALTCRRPATHSPTVLTDISGGSTMALLPHHADMVGSMLRPPRLVRGPRRRGARGSSAPTSSRRSRTRRSPSSSAQEQAVGMPAVTDGEFRRDWWHLDFLAELGGIGTAQRERPKDFSGEGESPPIPVVVGEVHHDHPIFVDAFTLPRRRRHHGDPEDHDPRGRGWRT